MKLIFLSFALVAFEISSVLGHPGGWGPPPPPGGGPPGVPAPAPSANAIPIYDYTGFEGYNTLYSSSKALELNNKNIVMNFYYDVFIPKKLDKVDTYVDSALIEHDPNGADGLDHFKQGFTATNGFYFGWPSIRRIAADGDLVWLHIKDDKNAYVDIYRIRNSKVVEHWDVIQALEPASSTAANSHPFF